MNRILVRVTLALGPLLLTLLLSWLTVQGNLNLGGGEKDVFLMLPLLAWSLLYLCACAVNWWRGAASLHGALWAAIVATALVLAPFLLYLLYWLISGLLYKLTSP